MKPSLVTATSGLMLAVPASVGLLLSASPTVLDPYPAVTVLPALLVSSRILGILVPSLLFFLWSTRLFRGATILPKASYILLLTIALLNAIWFCVGWKEGLHYQGAAYVYKVCCINAVWFAGLAVMFFGYAKVKTSFSVNLALNWLLFAWLAWYAFPYLGELP